jgi:CBS-domain-containing membrane protein
VIRFNESFRRLNARDLMGEIAVMIPQQMTLRDAACLLSGAEVCSAPVTDANGHCIGILSASAFVSWVAKGHDTGTIANAFQGCVWSDWQVLGEEANRKDEVCRHMEAARPLATPETSLPELLRGMAATGAHLVIVVDPERRPLGIVSAAHVLAVLVHEEEGRGSGPDAQRPAELFA